MNNPFNILYQVKVAELDATLRQAEKALRQTEGIRRRTLETHIKALNRYSDKLQKQLHSTTQSANDAEARANESDAKANVAGTQAAQAQSTAEELAGQIQPALPSPPAAQPPYGNMALGAQQDGQQEQSGGKANMKPKTLNLNVAGKMGP